ALQKNLGAAAPRGRGSGDPEAIGSHDELERHGEAGLPLAHELSDLLSHALDVAEQREGHCVEDRGLPRSRLAGDREHVELGEVDVLLVAECGESLDLASKRPHQVSPCTDARTSSNVSSSPSS